MAQELSKELNPELKALIEKFDIKLNQDDEVSFK